MVPTPRKRNASRSPDGNRQSKRLLTSSPEEGELDEPNPPPPMAPTPVMAPIALPPRLPALTTSKVPFPFKKKTEVWKNGPVEREATTLNVFDRSEVRPRDDSSRNRAGKSAHMDHWEPSYERGDPMHTRIDPYDGYGRNDHPGRDGWDARDRDRRRTPHRDGFPSTHSRSPGSPSHYRGRHRLPAARSPGAAMSPESPRGSEKTRERSRERVYERDRDRRPSWDDETRKSSWRDLSADDRYYRPSSPPNYRRDEKDWTWRDRHHEHSSRSRYENSSRWPSPRRVSPSTRSRPLSLRSSSQQPLWELAPQPEEASPRPPSSTPPPAPPPDPRLNKSSAPQPSQLPPFHAEVEITVQRPGAPRNVRSPAALEIPPVVPTEKAMAHGLENRVENYKPPVSEPPKGQGPARKEFKVSDHPLIQSLRSKPLVKRSQKEENQAYGHDFVGCGNHDDYETTTKLGEGTFGEVHKAVHKTTRAVVALKRILMHNEKEGMPVTALREIKILKALKHSCIVNILDMFVVRSKGDRPLSVYMVFPYMDHDLAGLLENERVKLQPSHIKLYMKQLLEGTAYMHRNHILHRDMKAANLLISNNGSLKIADFGLARSFDPSVSNGGASGDGSSGGRTRDRKYTNCVVTRWYRPPELLLGARHYGGEVDIWGIGCVLGEMFTRKPILPGTTDLDQLEKIWSLCGSPTQHNWPYFDLLPGCDGKIIRFEHQPRRLKQTYESVGPETVDLLDQLLMINPKERITAAAALEHEYFWTDPMPADPKTMPSYEASHEFDKRGHRHNQPPMPPPAGPPTGPAHHPPRGRHGQPPPQGGRNRGPHNLHHGGPDPHRRHGPGPGGPPNGPNGPYGAPPHLPPTNFNPPPQLPPNNHPQYPYPGPPDFRANMGPSSGLPPPHLPLPPPMLGPNGGPPPGQPPPQGMMNPYGPPVPLPPSRPPYPGHHPRHPYSQPFAPPPSGPQQPPYPPPHGPAQPRNRPHQNHFQGHGRGRWEQGQRDNRHSNTLPRPPPSLPPKPMAPMGGKPEEPPASQSEGLNYG